MSEYREHPILFKSDMVKAILEDRKTETRRILQTKWLKIVTVDGRDGPYDRYQEWRTVDGEYYECGSGPVSEEYPRDACPYGLPGDRLWVRETWGICNDNYTRVCTLPIFEYTHYSMDEPDRLDDGHQIIYKADPSTVFAENCEPEKDRMKWRPSIHMPRWASRIMLEVTDVRVERVRDISAEDARAEGLSQCCQAEGHNEVVAFHGLWDSINDKRGFGWDKNPWVWVIGFKRIKEAKP